MKKYRLLKDLPGLKAGAIFTANEYSIFKPDILNKEGNYVYDIPLNNMYIYEFYEFDEWFEEVEEEKKGIPPKEALERLKRIKEILQGLDNI